MQDKYPTLLDGLALKMVLEVMAKINSIVSLESFNSKFEQLPDAVRQQVMDAASAEARQNYDRWLDQLKAIPEVIFEARKALMRVCTIGGAQQVQQQFDRQTLNSAFRLLPPDIQKQLEPLIKAAKRL
jgi:aspartate ammonia-lyase